MTVVGVDACKGGWVAVVLAEGEPPAAMLLRGLDELELRVPAAEGVGVSQQAYALRSKVLEADAWLHTVELPVWEVHPEVSFTLMLGHPPSASKKSWAGVTERAGALRDVGVDLDGLEGPATLAGSTTSSMRRRRPPGAPGVWCETRGIRSRTHPNATR